MHDAVLRRHKADGKHEASLASSSRITPTAVMIQWILRPSPYTETRAIDYTPIGSR